MNCNIHGIILAGGKATRMNGIDKGLLKFQGKAMINHVLDRLKPQVNTVIVSANRNIEEYQQLHQTVIVDEGDAYRGPLVGIFSAMRQLQKSNPMSDWVVLAPCDAPLLDKSLVKRLIQHKQAPFSQYTALLPFDGVRDQPLFSMLPLTAMESLQKCLQQNLFKVSDWILSLQPVIVELSEIALSFENINSHEQLNTISNDRPR